MRKVSCEGKCRHCGRKFYKTKAGQAYCSSICRKARWAAKNKKDVIFVEKECIECGVIFKVPSGKKLITKYCSTPCKIKAGNKKRDERISMESKKRWSKQPITCQNCGKVFTPQKAAWARKHCSKRCRESFSSKRAKKRAKENKILRTAICEICNIEFIAKSSTHKFCSKTCLFKHSKKWYGKKKNKRYNKNNTWRYRKDHCELCGSSKSLQVHHIDGSGRDPKPNNSEDNLQTLCTVCHLDMHRIGFRVVDGELVVFGTVFNLFKKDSVGVINMATSENKS